MFLFFQCILSVYACIVECLNAKKGVVDVGACRSISLQVDHDRRSDDRTAARVLRPLSFVLCSLYYTFCGFVHA